MGEFSVATMTKSLVLISVLAFLFPGFAASDAPRVWDSETVSKLAGELAQQVKDIRTAARKEPQAISAATASKQRATLQFLETLKKLDRATGKLARQLASGETREQTTGTARRVDSLLKDAADQGRRLNPSQWTSQYADPALALAAQLRTFYSPSTDSTSTP